MPDRDNILFKHIRVDRFEGVGVVTEAVDLTDLGPGLNIVWGPNGRGKSCTTRAMTALLWADVPNPASAVIACELEVGGQGQPPRQIHGAAIPRLDGVPENIGPLYRLSLPDLLADGDEELVRKIRSELHGQVDLQGAMQSLGFRHRRPSRGIGEHTRCANTLKALQKAERIELALRQEADQLGQMEHRRQALQREVGHRIILERLRDLRSAEEALQHADQELKKFPSILARLDEKDDLALKGRISELNTQEDNIETWENQLADQREARDKLGFGEHSPPDTAWRTETANRLDQLSQVEADGRSARTNLAKDRTTLNGRVCEVAEFTERIEQLDAGCARIPDPAGLARLERGLSKLDAAEKALDDTQRAMGGVDRQFAETVRQLGDLADAERLNAWLAGGAAIHEVPTAVEAVVNDRVARQREDVWARLAGDYEEKLKHLAEPPAQAERAKLLLQDWLAASGQAAAVSPTISRAALTTATLLLVLVIVLTIALHALCVLGVVLPAAIVVWAWHKAIRPAPQTGEEDRLRREYEQLQPQSVPTSWTPEGVAACLSHHCLQLAAHDALRTVHAGLQTRAQDAAADREHASEALAEVERAFRRMLGVIPANWDPTHLNQLVTTIARLRQLKAEQERLREQAQTASEACNTARNELTQALNSCLLDPAVDATDLSQVVETLKAASAQRQQLLERLGRAEAEEAAARAQVCMTTATLHNLAEQRDELLTQARQCLAGWSVAAAAAGDHAALRAAFDALVNSSSTYNELTIKIANLEENLTTARARREQTQNAIEAWLDERELPTGRDQWPAVVERLAKHLEDYGAYRTAAEAKHACGIKVANAREKLDLNALDQELAALPVQQIQQRIDGMAGNEAELERLKDEIKDLRRRISEAQSGTSLEKALAEHEAALDTLCTHRDQTAAASIGALLGDFIREKGELGTSQALSKAKDLFGNFCRSEYQLAMPSADVDELEVRHSHRPLVIPLRQLSSGTRVQLLMAARLGYVTSKEDRHRPPIILDEALAIADPERSRAIMDAVMALVHDGRQVFYFTAQTGEVARWQAYLQQHALPEGEQWRIRTIGQYPAVIDFDAPVWTPPVWPRPEPCQTMESYGRTIGIPPIDGWADCAAEDGRGGADAVHLWYVVERPDTLYRCLQRVSDRCGGLLAYLKRVSPQDAAAALQCDAAELTRTTDRIRILERCLRLWRRGRSRPVQAEDLQNVDGIGRAGYEALLALCAQVRGDAGALLDRAPNLPHFGAGKVEALKQHLENRDLLTNETPLTGEGVARILRQEFGDRDDVVWTLGRLGLFSA